MTIEREMYEQMTRPAGWLERIRRFFLFRFPTLEQDRVPFTPVQTSSTKSEQLHFVNAAKDAPLLTFARDGKTAIIDVVDGKVVYGGDLEVGTSARLLFDQLLLIAGPMMAAKLTPAPVVDASGPRAYHDRDHHLLAYVDTDHAGAMLQPAEMRISLPSDVSVPLSSARAFGEALVKIADSAQLKRMLSGN